MIRLACAVCRADFGCHSFWYVVSGLELLCAGETHAMPQAGHCQVRTALHGDQYWL